MGGQRPTAWCRHPPPRTTRPHRGTAALHQIGGPPARCERKSCSGHLQQAQNAAMSTPQHDLLQGFEIQAHTSHRASGSPPPEDAAMQSGDGLAPAAARFVVILRAKARHLDVGYSAVAAQLRQLAFTQFGCLDFTAVTEEGSGPVLLARRGQHPRLETTQRAPADPAMGPRALVRPLFGRCGRSHPTPHRQALREKVVPRLLALQAAGGVALCTHPPFESGVVLHLLQVAAHG